MLCYCVLLTIAHVQTAVDGNTPLSIRRWSFVVHIAWIQWIQCSIWVGMGLRGCFVACLFSWWELMNIIQQSICPSGNMTYFVTKRSYISYKFWYIKYLFILDSFTSLSLWTCIYSLFHTYIFVLQTYGVYNRSKCTVSTLFCLLMQRLTQLRFNCFKSTSCLGQQLCSGWKWWPGFYTLNSDVIICEIPEKTLKQQSRNVL